MLSKMYPLVQHKTLEYLQLTCLCTSSFSASRWYSISSSIGFLFIGPCWKMARHISNVTTILIDKHLLSCPPGQAIFFISLLNLLPICCRNADITKPLHTFFQFHPIMFTRCRKYIDISNSGIWPVDLQWYFVLQIACIGVTLLEMLIVTIVSYRMLPNF